MKTTEEMMNSLLERKRVYEVKKRNTIKKVSTIAASLCLVIFAIILVPRFQATKGNNVEGDDDLEVAVLNDNGIEDGFGMVVNMTGNPKGAIIENVLGEHYEIFFGGTSEYISGMYIDDKPIEEVYDELDRIYETAKDCYYVRFYKDDVQYVIIGTDIAYNDFENIYKKEKK